MRAAIARRVGDHSKSFRVVPVLLPGAKRQQQSKLPPFLVAATWVEFARGTLDDDVAFHRLKCGILGIPPMSGPESPVVEGTCPYRGLQVFDVDDARLFFGRDTQVDWMLDRLERDFRTLNENRFLAVVGASGSGKSSLVRAGLIPALRSGHSRSGKGIDNSPEWPVTILKPGSEPLKALADALWLNPVAKAAVPDPLMLADQLRQDERRLHATIGTALAGQPDHRRFVIVVDQFEELFTQFEARITECRDDAQRLQTVASERTAFVDNLLYAATISGGRALVILTLRADFYAKCSSFLNLAAALGDAQELVPPLGDTDLRAAIEKPAQCCGLEFEPGLVDLLMQDMQRQPPGALPLLQQSLYMLYERRNGRRLTVEAYRDMGKIEGALEAHANQFYLETLTTTQQRDICRRVLMMLTNAGEGAEDTRRRVSRFLLGQSVEVDTVLQALVKARLITISNSNSPQVEVTHEALIRGWKRLRQWLDADRASLRTLQELVDAAEDWDKHHRDPAYLLTGTRLLQAEEWRASHPDDLHYLPRANTFLDTAVESRDAAQRRRRTRAITLATVGSILLVAASVSSIFFWWEKDRATRNERETRRVAAESLIQNGVTASQYDNDHLGAIYNFTRAMHVAGSDAPVARRAARNLISGSSIASYLSAFVHNDEVTAAAFSPDGKRIITGSWDKTAQIWDTVNGEPLGKPIKLDDEVEAISFSPDGGQVLTVEQNGTALLWEGYTGEPLGRLIVKDDGNYSRFLALSHDGQRVLFQGSNADALIFDRLSGKSIGKPIDLGASTTAKFSPNGKIVLTATHGETRLWDALTGEPLCNPMRDNKDTKVTDIAFSPDGGQVLTGHEGGDAFLWDGMTGESLGIRMQHQDVVTAVSFSPDGKLMLTCSRDNTARLWYRSTGYPIGYTMKHDSEIVVAAFSPDGKQIVTGSIDGSIRLWNGLNGQPLSRFMKHQKGVSSVVFSPDGRQILTGSYDNTARLWSSLTTVPLGHPMDHNERIWKMAFSPDSKRVLTRSDKTIRLWKSSTGSPLGHPMMHASEIFSAIFSPDGARILTASDECARLWDGITGAPLGRPMKSNRTVNAIAFSPVGNRVLTGDYGGSVHLWDGLTGDSLGQLMKHDDWINTIAFSPDGTRVLTASKRTALIWDCITGTALGQPMRHEKSVRTAAFSPDGERLLTASFDGTARLWDGLTAKPLGQPMKQDYVQAILFSPDGTRVATGGWDNTARLWDGLTGLSVGQPMRHEDYVTTLAFSPDGTRLLTGSKDETARLWDGKTAVAISQPMNHTSSVHFVAFSPDGTQIYTGSEDGKAWVWDTLTGTLLGQPFGNQAYGSPLAFSPDGTRVLTLTSDYAARLQEVPPPALDDPERIWLSTEVRTGWTIENGSRRALTPEEHQAKKIQLNALGGDCLNRTYNDLTEAEKLELRTPLRISSAATLAPSQP
jgi:WD40 repeat protein